MENHLLRRSAPLSSNIPPWVDSRQLSIVLTCAIAPVFTLTFMSLRIYARKYITKSLGWDDWVALITLALCLAYSVLIGFWTQHGGGMHQTDLQQLGMLQGYYKWIAISSPVYMFACMGYKAAILLLYLRLFRHQGAAMWLSSITLALVVAYLLSNFVTQLAGCRPLAKFWDTGITEGSCIDFTAADIGFGSLNVITDAIIFMLPMPFVWRSGLSGHDKAGVSLVFLTGAVAFAVALVRFQYAIKDLDTSGDRTYMAGLTFLWMVLEINTGLICSCTPALKPLFRGLVQPDSLDRFRPQPVKYALNSLRTARNPWSVAVEEADEDEAKDSWLHGAEDVAASQVSSNGGRFSRKEEASKRKHSRSGSLASAGSETSRTPLRTGTRTTRASSDLNEDKLYFPSFPRSVGTPSLHSEDGMAVAEQESSIV